MTKRSGKIFEAAGMPKYYRLA